MSETSQPINEDPLFQLIDSEADLKCIFEEILDRLRKLEGKE